VALTYMVFWMRKMARSIKGALHALINDRANSSSSIEAPSRSFEKPVCSNKSR
jgi:hypothetical protein